MNYSEIERRINKAHLRCCGGFYPDPSDEIDETIETVIIVGNAGNQKSYDFWSVFAADQNNGTDPLENWTRETLSKIAKDLNADALYPFDGPPYIPILTWAQRAESVHPTPFGPLIHSEYGLWHAYRGVLLFTEKIDLPSLPKTPSPCENCTDQACISTCPVDAVADGHFNVEGCAGFLASSKGEVCLQGGCAARRACPIGQCHIYEPAQAEFHLQAFLETYGPK